MSDDEDECHICIKMQERKPAWRQTGPSKYCILCKEAYCQAHRASKGPEMEADVCEINHVIYYRNHLQWRMEIFPTLKEKQNSEVRLITGYLKT